MSDQAVAEVKVDANLTQQKVDTTVPQETKKAEAAPESDKEVNWNKFKEARAIERKQAEEYQRRAQEKEAEAAALKAALEAIVNKPSQQSRHTNQDQYGEEENEDVRIQKKVDAALAVREKAAEAQRAQREAEEYPQRLVQAYSDFHQVTQASNLDYLDYHYPEISQAFQAMPDGFAKWSAIYKAVKRFIPNTESKKDSGKAENNLKKPQSISSGSISPTGEPMGANRLDEARKAANWARMEKVRKGLS